MKLETEKKDEERLRKQKKDLGEKTVHGPTNSRKRESNVIHDELRLRVTMRIITRLDFSFLVFPFSSKKGKKFLPKKKKRHFSPCLVQLLRTSKKICRFFFFFSTARELEFEEDGTKT